MILRSTWIKIRAVATLVETLLAYVAATFLVIVGAAQFDSTSPMHWVSQDEHVTTAADGKSFFVRRFTCLDRLISGEALPRLVSSGDPMILVPLPTKPISALVGCKEYSILVLIPDEVPPGDYVYRISYRINMNAFKTIQQDAPPVIVTVTR